MEAGRKEWLIKSCYHRTSGWFNTENLNCFCFYLMCTPKTDGVIMPNGRVHVPIDRGKSLCIMISVNLVNLVECCR